MSTSSKPPGTQYTEADWNEDSIKEVEQKGKDTPGSESYRASKTLAERALWGEFCVLHPDLDVFFGVGLMATFPRLDRVSAAPRLHHALALDLWT